MIFTQLCHPSVWHVDSRRVCVCVCMCVWLLLQRVLWFGPHAYTHTYIHRHIHRHSSNKVNSNSMDLDAVSPEPEVHRGQPKEPKSYSKANVLRTLKNAQKYSAYGIVAFAGLHLTTTVVLPAFSIDMANAAFMASRSIYQSDLGEMLLVYGSFGVHILSGLALHAYRSYRQYVDYGRLNFGKPSKTALSGLALASFTVLHFISMRYGPLIKLGDSSLISLDYVTYFLHNRRASTVLSLSALVGLFSMHSIRGAAQYFGFKIRGKDWFATAGLSTLAIVSLSALTMQPVVTGWISGQYDLAYSLVDSMAIL